LLWNFSESTSVLQSIYNFRDGLSEKEGNSVTRNTPKAALFCSLKQQMFDDLLNERWMSSGGKDNQ
jgi:hypothetical protein